MHNPKFLIITPTYAGRAGYLRRCIDSVRGQDYSNVTQYVIGDGPSPEERQVCAEAGVRYEELPKTGNWGCASRNYALDHPLAGDYYIWLDDDNALLPHCAGYLASAVEKDPWMLTFKTIHWQKWSGRFVVMPHISGSSLRPGDIDMLNVCVRQDIARLVRFDPARLQEQDFGWIAETMRLCEGQGCLHCPEILAVYPQ